MASVCSVNTFNLSGTRLFVTKNVNYRGEVMQDKIIVAIFSLMVFSLLFGLAWMFCWFIYGVYIEEGLMAAIPVGMVVSPAVVLCAAAGIFYPVNLIREYFVAEGEK